MRRVWVMGGGLAIVIAAATIELSATSVAASGAGGLLTQFYGLLLTRFEPGVLALAGSAVFGLVGMARRRRARQELS